ncbi:MAG: YbhB/YbcL family Raf kinase inhibitor-like protein [Bacteroidia bacterium]|nr:YbhB/YbcL family Raf kinase inhibitor-like protein [Bacteroidia bacterium]
MQRIISLSILFMAFIFQSFGQESFSLKSATLGGNASLTEEFNGFGCTGENTSPQLSWRNAPEGTKSFAITMYDPDAPTGSGWWHWVVFNIPSDINSLVEGAGDVSNGKMPKKAIQSITNYGVPGYGGPCPPQGHGIHQYVITVHALKVESLALEANTNPAVVGYYIWSNTLAKASIVTYYERKAK